MGLQIGFWLENGANPQLVDIQQNASWVIEYLKMAHELLMF